jgi:hypothetical protein
MYFIYRCLLPKLTSMRYQLVATSEFDIHNLGAVMNKIFTLVFPLAVAVAASLGSASANAAQTNAPAAPVAAAASQAAQTPHSLTRRDVYNQLVKAEKDGSLARLDATVFLGA